MMLYYPLLNEPLVFEENRINVLVIENPAALRTFISGLSSQINGMSGELILSVDFEPKELSKQALLLTDLFHPELETKKLLNKIQHDILTESEEFPEKVYSIIADIHALASDICSRIDINVTFSELNDFSEIIKILNFRPNCDELGFSATLLEWMNLYRKYFGKELFVFYGLKTFLSADELEVFYRSVFYEKLTVLLIEPFQGEVSLKEECVTIIDKDLCVLQ